MDERSSEPKILERLEQGYFIEWSTLSAKRKTQKPFVLAALKGGLPAYQVTDELLNDRDVILAIFSQARKQSYYEYIANDNDLKFKRWIEGRVTYDWKSDRELVFALCQNYTVAFSWLPDNWKEDEELVRLCTNDVHTLDLAGPAVKKKLGSDREFIRSLFSRTRRTRPPSECGKVLSFASAELQRDKELVIDALVHGCPFETIADELKEDHLFLREAFLRKNSVYLMLPTATKSDPTLSLMALKNCEFLHEESIIAEVNKHNPKLFEDRQKMIDVAESSSNTNAVSHMFKYCHRDLRADREFVMKFLSISGSVYEHLLEPFRSDPEVIACAIENTDNPSLLLENIPRQDLLDHPELAIQIVSHDNFRQGDYDSMPRELFERLDVALAFANNGCRLPEGFPTNHNNNRDLCISFLSAPVKDNPDDDSSYDSEADDINNPVYDWISDELLNDKSFLIDAIRDGHCWTILGKVPYFLVDYDVCLAVFSEFREDRYRLIEDFFGLSDVDDMLPMFVRKVKAKLQDRDAFAMFLCGMSVIDQHKIPPALRSPLPMLNLDKDTTKEIGKKIKAYVGVPVGEELDTLRHVWRDEKWRKMANT